MTTEHTVKVETISGLQGTLDTAASEGHTLVAMCGLGGVDILLVFTREPEPAAVNVPIMFNPPALSSEALSELAEMARTQRPTRLNISMGATGPDVTVDTAPDSPRLAVPHESVRFVQVPVVEAIREITRRMTADTEGSLDAYKDLESLATRLEREALAEAAHDRREIRREALEEALAELASKGLGHTNSANVIRNMMRPGGGE